MPSNKTNSAANPGRVCITLSFRSGVLLTLAMVATLLLVIAGANPAQAQEISTVRVSNLDKPVAGGEIMGFAHTFSQSFCTSNVTATLDQVRLYMSAHSWGTPAPVVSIRSYRSGNLGPVLHTLTNPSIDDSLDTAEDFASSGYELAANTTYWVSVFRPDDSGLIELGKTVSTAEHPATEAGWALGDMMLAKYGARWVQRESYALRMAVFATGGAPTISTPVFSDGGCDQKESYEFSVIENTAADTVVGAATAREPDGDSLTYSVGGTDAAKFNRVFALNASTGEITVKPGATVDYESKSSYSLTFSVTDGEDASGSTESEPTTDDTAQVSIRVTNIDEPGSVSLSTTDPRVGRSVTASISDPDGWPKPFRIEWARAFRATSAFIPFLPISRDKMTQYSYTPTEEDKYQFLRVTMFYYDNGCRRVHLFLGSCIRKAEAEFAKAVADEDGLIVQLQTVNTPATGELTLWRGDNPFVPRQLIAYKWYIRDADGMIGSRLRYQWITVDPRTGVETKVYNNNSCQCNPLNTYTLRNVARGKAVMVRARFEDDRGNTEVVASRLTTLVPVVGNTAARGGIGVRGTARVGATLSVHTSSITDADGMEDSEFTYQWLTSEGTYNTSIEGATGSTYVPVAADEGMSIKVRIGFTDDAGYYESFTSGGTAPVAAAPVSLFTASTHDTPESHDGSAAFTFELRFSEAPADGVTDSTLEDHALAVIGGTVTDVSQLETGKNLRWEITVQPSGNEEVIVTLPPTIDCAAQGAICTGDGRMLSVALAILVPGPQNAPTITGTARVGETLTASTTGISDSDGLTNATFTYQWIKLDSNLTNDSVHQRGDELHLHAGGRRRRHGYQGPGVFHRRPGEYRVADQRVGFDSDGGQQPRHRRAHHQRHGAGGRDAHGKHHGHSRLRRTGLCNLHLPVDKVGQQLKRFGHQRRDGLHLHAGGRGRRHGYQGPGIIHRRRGEYRVADQRVGFDSDGGQQPRDRRAHHQRHGPGGRDAHGEHHGHLRLGRADRTGLCNLHLPVDKVGQQLKRAPPTLDQGPGVFHRQNTESLTNEFTGAPTISWYGPGGRGATSSTYTLVAADAGTGIKVRVSFTDDAGNTESLTNESALIVMAANNPATGAPTISGTARVGETLTASTTGIADSDGLTNVTFTYQWLADDAAISGATASTHTLVAADAGKAIKVRVSFTDDAGNTESLTSGASAAVTAAKKPASGTARVGETLTANNPATGAPTISGTARVGETLTASATGIADTDGLTNATFTYQWLADDADIAGATGSTYTLVAADAGKAIKVQVSFTDDAGNAESLTSAATTAAALPPLTASAHDVPASHDGSAAFTFELHFSETPNDGFSYKTLRDHAFTATGGEVVKARRLERGKNVRWEITVQPSGNAGVTVALPATTDCSSQGAICTGDGRKLSSALEVSVPGPEASSQQSQQQNSAATGAPAITGTARVGETLTANTTGIADSDGLTRATFAYQWLADDADITDATGSTYTPAAIDAGKAIIVEVSFTDDAGNAETLTSAATAAVTLPPLTASAHGVPASHDGSAAFTFELRFSEEMPLSYKTLRDHAFTATGGEVVKARRLERGQNVRWEITVRPDGDGTVTIVLPVTEDCASNDAICTEDGRPLSNRLQIAVPGPEG